MPRPALAGSPRRPLEDDVMTRHDRDVGQARCPARLPFWLLGGLGAVALVLAGCVTTNQPRGKADDEPEAARYDLPTVGERTDVANAAPLMLGGVGLVTDLEGTGGDCPHDSYRAMLVEHLRKEGVQNVNKLLGSPDCAVVVIEAALPPGTARGERIDVEVKLPPGSRATSLRGGVLRKSPLRNYELAQNLRPDSNGPQGMIQGHKLAEASGPILVSGDGGDDSPGLRHGRIWQGARALIEQPLALVMHPDSQQARFTSLISDRINNTFQPNVRNIDTHLAHTADNVSISLRVPPQYRYNLPRYLQVVRVIPLSDSNDFVPKEGQQDRRSYRQKLADDLLDPSRTVVAAIRLEALGQPSLPTLKAGLKSPYPLVRFASAEALTYLGSAAGCEELGGCAVKYPILRSNVLAALASLDEAASVLQLRKMILSDLDDEGRCGAMRALQLLNERDPLVRGERLNDSFWLNVVTKEGRPLVHVSTTKRAEVALFGVAPALKAPFHLLAGEYIVTAAEEGSSTAMVSYVGREGRTARKPCSLEMEEVIRTMAEMGASFPEVVAMLQQAASCESVSCPVRVDALPQAPSAQQLAELGKVDPAGYGLLPAGSPATPQGGTR